MASTQTEAHVNTNSNNNISTTMESDSCVIRRRTVTGPLHLHTLNEEVEDERAWQTQIPTLRKPERKRVSSEGEVHRVMKKYDDYDYDTDHEDFDQNEMEDDADFFFTPPIPPPQRRLNNKLTAAALALKHGAALALQPQQQQPRKTLKQNKKQQQKQQYINPWLIPVNHPLKMAWDVLTVVLSIVNVIMTHRAIRDRKYNNGPGWIEAWFLLDILLNFWTQRTTPNGTVLKSFTAVASRYLTSWFVIDVLALFPGEILYIQPVIELQKRRKLWEKIFRRTKVTVKVTTRILQSGHVPWLYKVVVKARPIRECVKLIKLLITYIPKYLLFVRQMKGVLVIRVLRDFGHVRALRRFVQQGHFKDVDAATVEMTSEDDWEDWERLHDNDIDDDPDDDEDDNDVGPF